MCAMGWSRAELYDRYAGRVTLNVEVEADVLRQTSRILPCPIHSLICCAEAEGGKIPPILYEKFDSEYNPEHILPLEIEADFVRAAAKILKEPYYELLERVGIASRSASEYSTPDPHGASLTRGRDIQHHNYERTTGASPHPPIPTPSASPEHPVSHVDRALASASTPQDNEGSNISASSRIALDQAQQNSMPIAGGSTHSQPIPGLAYPTAGAAIGNSTQHEGNAPDASFHVNSNFVDTNLPGAGDMFLEFLNTENVGFPGPGEPQLPTAPVGSYPNMNAQGMQGMQGMQGWNPASEMDQYNQAYGFPDGDPQTMPNSSANADVAPMTSTGAFVDPLAPFSQDPGSFQNSSRFPYVQENIHGYLGHDIQESENMMGGVSGAMLPLDNNLTTDGIRPFMPDSDPQWQHAGIQADNIVPHDRNGLLTPNEIAAVQCSKPHQRSGPASNAVSDSRVVKNAPRTAANRANRNKASLGQANHKKRACVRCASHQVRCDLNDHTGICTKCSNLGGRAFFLPCLFVSITDGAIYRTNTTLACWQRFPFHGYDAGRLSMIEHWDTFTVKPVKLSQGRGGSIELTLTQFEVPDDILDVERQIFRSPWGLYKDDLDRAKSVLNTYVDGCMTAFVERDLRADDITWNVFKLANSLARNQNIEMLRSTLRLWTAARCIETDWYEVASGSSSELAETAPAEVPDVADHQLAVVVIGQVLDPLRNHVFACLKKMYVKSGKTAKDRLVAFLTSYILLQHLELLIKQQSEVAIERNSPHRFTNMALIKELQLAANAILVHMHVAYGKRNIIDIFEEVASGWRDNDDKACMDRIIRSVNWRREELVRVSKSDIYDYKHYFTGQLFDERWEPRTALDRPIPI